MKTATFAELQQMWKSWKDQKSSVARVVAPILMDAAKKQRAAEAGFPGSVAADIDNAIRCAEAAEAFIEPEMRNDIRPTIIWNNSFDVNYW